MIIRSTVFISPAVISIDYFFQTIVRCNVISLPNPAKPRVIARHHSGVGCREVPEVAGFFVWVKFELVDRDISAFQAGLQMKPREKVRVSFVYVEQLFFGVLRREYFDVEMDSADDVIVRIFENYLTN